MKVLVACEFSGTVRDAFLNAGHDAISCDLLPSESPGPHIQGDAIRAAYSGEYDLMIGHPPCTYMANSGVRWLHPKDEFDKPRAQRRWEDLAKARRFFLKLWNSPIPLICIENPIPHKYANLPPYTQTVQPYEHGDPETKRACLWLKGLPKLIPTNIIAERAPRVHMMPPGPNRQKERSRFFPGIAAAMASQWGNLK